MEKFKRFIIIFIEYEPIINWKFLKTFTPSTKRSLLQDVNIIDVAKIFDTNKKRSRPTHIDESAAAISIETIYTTYKGLAITLLFLRIIKYWIIPISIFTYPWRTIKPLPTPLPPPTSKYIALRSETTNGAITFMRKPEIMIVVIIIRSVFRCDCFTNINPKGKNGMKYRTLSWSNNDTITQVIHI